MGNYRHRCPWCREFRTREEMRGRTGGTGPAPLTCHTCRTGNPDLSWCKYHEAPHPVEEFPQRPGRAPDLLCHRAAYQVYEAPGEKICPWCGERKTLAEMKGLLPGTRGKGPSACHDCRTSHPDQAWCTFHLQPHPLTEFSLRSTGQPQSWCRVARHETRYPDLAPIMCVSCRTPKSAGNYAGNGFKRATCRACEAANPGKKWCRECAAWRGITLFPQGTDASGALCTLCLCARKHGTTVAKILALQGVDAPVCEACGATERLNVDHDHGCCPTMFSCGKCVLGYLCWRCNSSEGQLVTSERAFALAEHMVRREKTIAERRQIS